MAASAYPQTLPAKNKKRNMEEQKMGEEHHILEGSCAILDTEHITPHSFPLCQHVGQYLPCLKAFSNFSAGKK